MIMLVVSGCSSLTFEGVRRLLEKDLGLETYALDVHKRFVKQFLLEVPLWICKLVVCMKHERIIL